MTPHNKAKVGEVSPYVLMPGDPLRAKYIAQTYLENVSCYNDVRNALGFTGTYRGVKVSVQSSGMGMPSFTIYAYELFEFYACKIIIRIGTCGGLQDWIEVGDLIFSMGACTDSAMNRSIFGGQDYAAIADFKLLRVATDIIESQSVSAHVGLVLSSDHFYDNAKNVDLWSRYGVLAVEMETAALYTLSARYRARGLSILKVSDHITKDVKGISTEEREKGLGDASKIALDTLVCMSSFHSSSL